jgi:hypothetical protein
MGLVLPQAFFDTVVFSEDIGPSGPQQFLTLVETRNFSYHNLISDWRRLR